MWLPLYVEAYPAEPNDCGALLASSRDVVESLTAGLMIDAAGHICWATKPGRTYCMGRKNPQSAAQEVTGEEETGWPK